MAGRVALLPACDDGTPASTSSTSNGSSGADGTAADYESSGGSSTSANHAPRRKPLPRIDERSPRDPYEPGLQEPWVPRDHYRPPPIHVPEPRVRIPGRL